MWGERCYNYFANNKLISAIAKKERAMDTCQQLLQLEQELVFTSFTSWDALALDNLYVALAEEKGRDGIGIKIEKTDMSYLRISWTGRCRKTLTGTTGKNASSTVISTYRNTWRKCIKPRGQLSPRRGCWIQNCFKPSAAPSP